MKLNRKTITLLLIFTCVLFLTKQAFSLSFQKQNESSPVVYSPHWPFPLPLKNLNKYPMVSHHIFTLQFDFDTRFPVFVAYHLSPQILWGNLKSKRDYTLDPHIQKKGLSYSDYKGASNCDKKGRAFGYDKGHLAPLGSFKASVYAYEAQYTSNIVPQKSDLNQGPWRIFEEKVRKFIKKGNEVSILTGPLYKKESKKTAPCWKAAQSKIKEVPGAFFKVVLDLKNSKVCSVIMPQTAHRRSPLKKFKTSISEIEKQSGLKILTLRKNLKENCSFLF